MSSCSGTDRVGTGRSIGPRDLPLSAPNQSRPATPDSLSKAAPDLHPAAGALYRTNAPHAGNEVTGPQVQDAPRTRRLRRRAPGRERLHAAQAGADVRDPQAARAAGD